jgi:predicted Zn-dependent protease
MQFRWAEDLFARRDYFGAAKVLEGVIADVTDAVDHHGLTDARTLLARSYYHSAQLRRAEATARDLLADDPSDAYAALLLSRTLERANRRDEAATYRALATALGAPGTTAA